MRGEDSAPVGTAWALSVAHILEALQVDEEEGLSRAEAASRLESYGPNELRERRRISALSILLSQFKSLVVGLLLAACAVSFAFGEWAEGVAIAAVILVNALLGFATELHARRSMEALRRLGRETSRVRRDGEVWEVDSAELVPGDLAVLEAGDVVGADLRLVEASKLEADESLLTGESVPVSKDSEPVSADAELPDRRSMLFKGTAVSRGSALGVVVATGMATELGHIASMVEEAEEGEAPIEKRLEHLGGRLVWLTLAIAATSSLLGILGGRDVLLMIQTGIALAVAAIPEGLPIVATITLARGMWRMAQRHALINRLSAVETLGATTVLFTDKTGTLTENRLTVTRVALASGTVEVSGEGLELEGELTRDGEPLDEETEADLRRALEVAVLCNNASVHRDDSPTGDRPAAREGGGSEDGEGQVAVGDPLEVALLVAGRKAGIDREALLEKRPEEREEAFEPARRMMATIHGDGDRIVAVKGAGEAVLSVCTRQLERGEERDLGENDRSRWLERAEAMAAGGLRVLALARKTDGGEDDPVYEGLTFLALVGMLDPPREDVRDALADCATAGIRVNMVTGDQPATARAVALAVGLVKDDDARVITGRELKQALADEQGVERLEQIRLFARVDPEQKLDLVRIHQRRGEVVAMTGDGVNDAPALKAADIGVAMGRRGTQVARETADMILQDDRLASIVAAVWHGRTVFENIRKFVFYLLSCNVSEIFVVSAAAIPGVPLPLLPLQILFLNLVTDVFPALALGMGEAHPSILERPPRDPKEPVLERRHWLGIGAFGLLLTGCVLAALLGALYLLGYSGDGAVTISFLTLAFAQLWHVLNMRRRGTSAVRNELSENPWIWGALLLCVLILLCAVYLPGLSEVLRLKPPGAAGWGLILAASLVPLAAGQIWSSLPAKRA